MARKFDIHQLEEFLVGLKKSGNLTEQQQLEVEKYIQLVRDLKGDDTVDDTDSEVVVSILTLIAQFLIEYFKNGN